VRAHPARIRKLILRSDYPTALAVLRDVTALPAEACPRVAHTARELERCLEDEDQTSAVFWNERLAAELRHAERVAALQDTGLLDSPREESFDAITRRVAARLGVPIALVSLVDENRQFFKSSQGLPEPWNSRRETPLSHSFCQHVVSGNEPLVVVDARTHRVVRDNLAVPELGVIAYCGVPILTRQGTAIGSLCAIDTKPRVWTEEDQQELRTLADAVEREVERFRTRRKAAAAPPREPTPTPDVDPILAGFAAQFLQVRREDVNRISAWLEDGQLTEIARIAHQIKGNSATFGFPEIGEVGGRLETAARSGDTRAVAIHLESLRHALNGV
jgi:GAF domain-containing protein